MFRNYFKTAFRNLFRNKVYSFINIAGLSLGLACVLLIILYVKDEVSYDRFQKNAGQIYHIVRKLENPDGRKAEGDGYTGYPQGPQFTAAIPEIKEFVRIENGWFRDIKTGGNVESQQVLYVDSNFLSVFSFPLLSGNPKTALLQPNGIVISEEIAKKQFGSTDVLGKIILLKEHFVFEPRIVTGVARTCPQNSSIKFNFLLPLKVSADDENNSEAWLNIFLNTFVVLNKKADLQAVEAKMKTVFDTNGKEAKKIAREKYSTELNTIFRLQPLLDMHLSTAYPPIDGLTDASDPMFSYVLSGISIFILLIACINFINLTVARSVKRAKEIGIRKVIGGSRKQLILQFLGESFILCSLSFVLAVLIAWTALPVFNMLSNKALALSYLLDVKLITGYISLFIVTALLAGFYPALVLSNYNPVQTLYNRFAIGGKNWLQKSLVIFQFALASFLIIVTLTIFSQFNYLTNKKLGYDDSNLVVIHQWRELNPETAKLFRQELIASPNIIGVAPKNIGYYNTNAKVNGEKEVPLVIETVDDTYLPLLKIPVIQGRNFSKDFPSDSNQSVLVNEAFVKRAGWKNPIGQEVNFWFDGKKVTVIGVVKDHYFQPLNEVIKPELFSLTLGRGYGRLYIKIRPGSETASLQQIEKTFKKIFPLSPYSFIFKNQENREYYSAEAKWKQIILFGAVLTIFISCIGLFGLSVLSAEKRTKEIGIRKVLGASVRGLTGMLSKDFLKLVSISLLLAMPIAWIAANKWLENYPNRITLNIWIFISAALLVIIIAMATVSFQAIKVAISNPVRSLRSE